jgi:carbamoyl-phosphate synthase large subunit
VKRELFDSIQNVLVIGSGPIVIGQACEFDYSGTQACKALREEGKRVVLLNSNPATIMTDPDVSDRTYIEPVDITTVISILRREGIDSILPTMGGQTALNLAMNLAKTPDILDSVKVIGANLRSIHLAEDRRAFRELVANLGMDTPKSRVIRSVAECKDFAHDAGFPFILRPSFTLGGSGQDFVFGVEELAKKCQKAIDASPVGEVLVEESALGWKEFELEVMRDYQDNAIVVCSIENLDAMGVHTGDSITIAPAQTLTDREYQAMRTDALKLIRAVGVEAGGCNVQFAVHPKTGRRIVIEMNPRVSRSSALASKATGFPIAYVSAKLSIGYALSEIDNNITGTTKACFEPPIDYVAIKIPRWNFEKFQGAKDILKPQMQAVGEVLSIGASVGEAFHKALTSLERSWPKFKPVESTNSVEAWHNESESLLALAHSRRAYAVWDALACGVDADWLAQTVEWDPFFTRQIAAYQKRTGLGARALRQAELPARYEWIDTCSAEIRAKTPFFYSTRLELSSFISETTKTNSELNTKKRVVILGSGPNRIGQGVEFDYCCVHASLALQRLGFETIMINCNPETVSTDPSVSTRLYLEPLEHDSVKSILDRELVGSSPQTSFVLVQTGGQTPLKLAKAVTDWGYSILGTSPEAIDLSEDREKFAALLKDLKIHCPPSRTATSLDESLAVAHELGYPVIVRPSFVLGGRGMKLCSRESDLIDAFSEAKEVSENYPLFIDKYLVGAIEFDIDGICDGKDAWIAGVMEHVEEAGIHSGDSACVIPPIRLPRQTLREMIEVTKKLAVACGARGLFNIQMAVIGDQIYVIEANPRASRTVPFLAKATGLPIIEWGIRAALGESISSLVPDRSFEELLRLPNDHFAVKVPVFPFEKFENVDPILGPEMRSTGEVMGVDKRSGAAFAKAYLGAGLNLPVKGRILFSVRDLDKPRSVAVARVFELLGFEIWATSGTASYFKDQGIDVLEVAKIGHSAIGSKDLLGHLEARTFDMVVNTAGSAGSFKDGTSIRQVALKTRVPLMGTLAAAEMASLAIKTLIKEGTLRPLCLQEMHGQATIEDLV